MRVAFFSPLPPARSGIADYSEALSNPSRRWWTWRCSLPPVSRSTRRASISRSTRWATTATTSFVYETALRHPGVVVMHESNLHHLIADLTIKRGDWDAYVRECEYNGGAAARASPSACAGWKWGPITKACP